MSLSHGACDDFEDGPITFLILRLATIGGFLPSEASLSDPYIQNILNYGDSWEFGQSRAILAMTAVEQVGLFSTALRLLESEDLSTSVGFFERAEFKDARFDLEHYGRETVINEIRRYLGLVQGST